MRAYPMYVCVNCGERVAALYRRYCPSVLKLLKCDKCGLPADKYIEYDPVIVLVDVILVEKRAYRHLLYNSSFITYWKLMVALCLSESLRIWSCCGGDGKTVPVEDDLAGNCNFYGILANTAIAFGAFVCTVLIISEMSRRLLSDRSSSTYTVKDTVHALVIGGCGKLLGLLCVVWTHVASGPHYFLIQGYTTLCLVTAYSVVTKSGKAGATFGIATGLVAYSFFANWLLLAAPAWSSGIGAATIDFAHRYVTVR